MRIVPELKAGATISETLRLTAQTFKAAGIETPDADARALLGHTLRLSRAQLVSQSEHILDVRERDAVAALAARRLKREPVARILGVKEFWSLPLAVTADVLVPRPDSETVVEAALDALTRDGLRAAKLRVLDIGTGSGALLLALLSELPNASGVGTDISAAALAVARGNAVRNGLVKRCTFVACHIAAGIEGPFDLVVANPPYLARGEIATLAPEVRDYDPAIALDGGTDGLDFYRAIASEAPRLLASAGRLIVELGIGQETAVRTLFTKAGLFVGAVRNDLAGIPRALGATTVA
ncbi:MAG TPA: peptide chain release factor N(5)-glutamine methyltransferase [Pseudolabrys sp.]|nr:peptide chain release factor N(5)-glutamine methyltransferase [Pseudolabrys sp.]